jgi:hypothetical protein
MKNILLKIFCYNKTMEHIFETVYPDYKKFKENIFYETQEFLLDIKNIEKILVSFTKINIKNMNDIVKESDDNKHGRYKYYLKILNEKYPITRSNRQNDKKFIYSFDYTYKEKIFDNAKEYIVDLPFKFFLNYFNFNLFEITKKVLRGNRVSPEPENVISYYDIYGNIFYYYPYFRKLKYLIVRNKGDLRFFKSYFNFYAVEKFNGINLETFYEDNADFIERIKERYYSLPQVKKEEEEKNKFEEIQKELIELKNQLKIKDEEISKIKDDLDDKNKLLKKILTKL